jgi:hypothetical protein
MGAMKDIMTAVQLGEMTPAEAAALSPSTSARAIEKLAARLNGHPLPPNDDDTIAEMCEVTANYCTGSHMSPPEIAEFLTKVSAYFEAEAAQYRDGGEFDGLN